MKLFQFAQMVPTVPKFDPLGPAKNTFHAELCNPITRQAIELDSCSNPLRIQQVL